MRRWIARMKWWQLFLICQVIGYGFDRIQLHYLAQLNLSTMQTISIYCFLAAVFGANLGFFGYQFIKRMESYG